MAKAKDSDWHVMVGTQLKQITDAINNGGVVLTGGVVIDQHRGTVLRCPLCQHVFGCTDPYIAPQTHASIISTSVSSFKCLSCGAPFGLSNPDDYYLVMPDYGKRPVVLHKECVSPLEYMATVVYTINSKVKPKARKRARKVA